MDPNKEKDDPELNMTPMIDVVFQLMIVFLCSMKFRTLDMKIEAFLPKDVGLSAANPTSEVETKLIVRLKWDKATEKTQVLVLENRIGSTAQEGGAVWNVLAKKIKQFHSKDPEMKGEIDAHPDVPHGDVMKALDSFLAADLTNVVFKGTPLNESGQFGPQR
ncbi:MAG: ExbD/TolR family protein [Planctomycetota bacterium]|jgi:biopolymer transport protein ExbD